MGVPLSTETVVTGKGQGRVRGSAPGHLGELTQQAPFEMVDAVLVETGTGAAAGASAASRMAGQTAARRTPVNRTSSAASIVGQTSGYQRSRDTPETGRVTGPPAGRR